MKTVKEEEAVARSRFIDCPVCKNHTLKLKRTVQVGRCKSCNETYKILIVFVKTGKRTKPPVTNPETPPETKQGENPQVSPESTLPSWELPSDTSLFGSTSDTHSGTAEDVFGGSHSDQNSRPESTGTQ